MTTVTDFASLKTAILTNWLDDSEANVDVDQCIQMAESRFNRLLDTPEMETVATIVTTAEVDLPADCRAIKSLHLETDPRARLEPVSVGFLRSNYTAQTTGQPQVYAIIGTQIIFGPDPDSTYSATLVYRKPIEALSTTNPTNWLIEKHPDLYMVATLMAAEAQGWNDPRAASLKSWWDEIMSEVVLEGQRARIGGAPIRVRSPVRGAC